MSLENAKTLCMICDNACPSKCYKLESYKTKEKFNKFVRSHWYDNGKKTFEWYPREYESFKGEKKYISKKIVYLVYKCKNFKQENGLNKVWVKSIMKYCEKRLKEWEGTGNGQ